MRAAIYCRVSTEDQERIGKSRVLFAAGVATSGNRRKAPIPLDEAANTK